VLHAFAGDPAAAARATRSGFYLGAGGPITYPSAKTLRATLADVQPARLLIETDAPYLSPQAHRGQRNEPAYVRYVAEALGALTLLSREDLTEVVRSNAAHLFAWDHGHHHAQLC
jgi:TatD DNase family protein